MANRQVRGKRSSKKTQTMAFTGKAFEVAKFFDRVYALIDDGYGLVRKVDAYDDVLEMISGTKSEAAAKKNLDKLVDALKTAVQSAGWLQSVVPHEIQQTQASFKGAVPGNLGANPKPSTKKTQKEAVDLLKQGGILPPDANAKDYPVLTAKTKRAIIATLLKHDKKALANWAARNLLVSNVSLNAAADPPGYQAALKVIFGNPTQKAINDLVMRLPEDQIKDAQKAFHRQGPGLWRRWVKALNLSKKTGTGPKTTP